MINYFDYIGQYFIAISTNIFFYKTKEIFNEGIIETVKLSKNSNGQNFISINDGDLYSETEFKNMIIIRDIKSEKDIEESKKVLKEIYKNLNKTLFQEIRLIYFMKNYKDMIMLYNFELQNLPLTKTFIDNFPIKKGVIFINSDDFVIGLREEFRTTAKAIISNHNICDNLLREKIEKLFS